MYRVLAWRQSTAQTCEVTDADDNGSGSGARGDEPCGGGIIELDQSDARASLLTARRPSGSWSKPSAASRNTKAAGGRRVGFAVEQRWRKSWWWSLGARSRVRRRGH